MLRTRALYYGIAVVAFPKLFPPMVASELPAPFHRDGWVYEEKYDGYRCLVFKRRDGVALVSRNLSDMTSWFPGVASAVAALPASTLVLDAEIAVFDEELVSHLGYLGRHARKFAPARKTTPPVLVAFDCLFARGRDLRGRPLNARRKALDRELDGAAGPIVLARRLEPNGLLAWQQVKNNGWEGMVCKDDRSIYEPGKRTSAWIKVKHRVRRGWPEEGLEVRRS